SVSIQSNILALTRIARIFTNSKGGLGCFSPIPIRANSCNSCHKKPFLTWLPLADTLHIAHRATDMYHHIMTLQDIKHEALGLTESERAELVLSLMCTLAAPGAEIPDEEVSRRDTEMESGTVEPILH